MPYAVCRIANAMGSSPKVHQKMAVIIRFLVLLAASLSAWTPTFAIDRLYPPRLEWKRLPDLPGKLGVAGPAVGVHNDRLIVAGGANFPEPVWDSGKVWRDAIYMMRQTASGPVWQAGGKLRRPLGYCAAVSTPEGVVCMGGNDAANVFRDVFLLRWNAKTERVEQVDYPPLPEPCAFGQAVLVDKIIYLAGGQSGLGLDSALANFWMLDLSKQDDARSFKWRTLKVWPGGQPRSLSLTVAQSHGGETAIFVMSGRCEKDGQPLFLRDAWSYSPKRDVWKRHPDSPRAVMAGMAAGLKDQYIYVVGGADGALFNKADELRDNHPGFPKETLVYDTKRMSWQNAGPMPAAHVTTVPVMWNGRVIIASGEIRPRVRSKAVWSIAPSETR